MTVVVVDLARTAQMRRDALIIERARLAGCLLAILELGGFDEMKRLVDHEIARVAAARPEAAAQDGWIR